MIWNSTSQILANTYFQSFVLLADFFSNLLEDLNIEGLNNLQAILLFECLLSLEIAQLWTMGNAREM